MPAWALILSRHIPLGKSQIAIVHLDREHWNKPREFSILRWRIDNHLSVRKIQIFYSSKNRFPDSQPVYTLHTVEIPYIWLFWLCEILALLGQNRGKEIMAHINFGPPRV